MTRWKIDQHGRLQLPEGLTVGDSLDLEGTQIAELPEGLTVGGLPGPGGHADR